MRRHTLLLALLVFIAGCTSARPPVDPAACTSSGAGLQVRLAEELRWRVHPLSTDSLRVPSAVVVVCNADSSAAGEQYLTLTVTDEQGVATPGRFQVPRLEPGTATDPMLVYAERGVPPAFTELWQADGSAWPDWTLTVRNGDKTLAEARVRRTLAGEGPEAPGGKPLAFASLTLDQIRQMALSRTTLELEGKGRSEWFVHARDAVYTVVTAPSCMAQEGQTVISGRRWALWSGGEGAILTKVGDLGTYSFPGGRQVSFRTLALQQVTFLLVEQYASCANPHYSEIWAYDHAAGALYRPHMEAENGKLEPASAGMPELRDDGTLVRKVYLNAGDTGWHTYTYRWDGPARTWRLTSHTKQQ